MKEVLPKAEISDSEWEVMRVVWTRGQISARSIIDGLSLKLGWKESTTKTLIRRLLDKGYLTVTREDSLNHYIAALPEETCTLMMADKLFKRVCNTRHGEFLAMLIQRYELSPADAGHIEEILKGLPVAETIECSCDPCQCDYCPTHGRGDQRLHH